jgi:uncharacterized membrane protein
LWGGALRCGRGDLGLQGFFGALLLLATLLCSLVAGFLFAFAVVVMPGIGKLDDRGFIRVFQAIDRVIQNNQPVFLAVWVGSMLALMAALILGLFHLRGSALLLMVAALFVYLFGVQLPTIRINVPLNNEMQRVDLATTSEYEQTQIRSNFERRWNRWNVVRTACAILVSFLLLIVLIQL